MSAWDDSSEDDDYGLVLPFVCVSSAGGLYDDAAFIAGFHLGQIDARLSLLEFTKSTLPLEETVREDSLQQLDLIAMHHGYIVEEEGTPASVTGNLAADDPSEWRYVTIRKTDA